jgi:energy-coupling factor transport system ATP-binding protein
MLSSAFIDPIGRGREVVKGRLLIDVRDLAHSYLPGTLLEVRSLRNVSLEVYENETLGIVGPTGSGKSTLLYHLNGLLRPQKGEVQVRGISLSDKHADVKKVRRMVGLVFQNPEDQLFEQFAGDDVAFGPRNEGLSRDAVRERVRKALEMVGLPFSFKDRPCAALSLGEKRRIALAGIFAMEPSVLVLDEPTASLDPAGRRDLIGLLQKWRRVRGRSMVVVSHSMEDIALLTDRTSVLKDGSVVYSGLTRELFSSRTTLEAHGLQPPVSLQVLYALEDQGFSLRQGSSGLVPMNPHQVADAIGEVLHGQGN